jgi:succinyl-CoA synthetase alpha subunit
VQGITGRQAQISFRLMRDYGTRVVAGVTPGKGGQLVDEVPVYNTVAEALQEHPGITASAAFVPARFAKSAALEAINGGLKLLVLLPERMPQQDMLEIIAYARKSGTTVIGPNTPGVVSPEKGLVGLIGATAEFARQFFRPGPVGVMSRSGGATTTLCYYLTRSGIGQSTALGVGGDAFVGATWVDLLPLFEKDPETKVVAVYGEIGTTIEEDAANLILDGKFTKPMVAYIAGRYARPEMRFGHAGAIIYGRQGLVETKVSALRAAGVHVVDHFSEIGPTARQLLS